MKKAAIFVEGQTELMFVKKLIDEIAGASNVIFHEERLHAKSYLMLESPDIGGEKYFILIVDCCSDSAVLSAIIERHHGLGAAGYELILGLRDLYPLDTADLANLKSAVAGALPSSDPKTHIMIAVREVEAWFIQESTHFTRIDAACTRQAIRNMSGHDIDTDSAETILHPADFLKFAYQLGGKTYRKKKTIVSRTVNSLDYANLYVSKRAILSSFDEFVSHIEDFLG